MKRSGFLKTLAALFVVPKFIESKINTHDDKNEYLYYKDFVKEYPLSPEECFQFNDPTKELYDGTKFNNYMDDETGQTSPK